MWYQRSVRLTLAGIGAAFFGIVALVGILSVTRAGVTVGLLCLILATVCVWQFRRNQSLEYWSRPPNPRLRVSRLDIWTLVALNLAIYINAFLPGAPAHRSSEYIAELAISAWTLVLVARGFRFGWWLLLLRLVYGFVGSIYWIAFHSAHLVVYVELLLTVAAVYVMGRIWRPTQEARGS